MVGAEQDRRAARRELQGAGQDGFGRKLTGDRSEQRRPVEASTDTIELVTGPKRGAGQNLGGRSLQSRAREEVEHRVGLDGVGRYLIGGRQPFGVMVDHQVITSGKRSRAEMSKRVGAARSEDTTGRQAATYGDVGPQPHQRPTEEQFGARPHPVRLAHGCSHVVEHQGDRSAGHRNDEVLFGPKMDGPQRGFDDGDTRGIADDAIGKSVGRFVGRARRAHRVGLQARSTLVLDGRQQTGIQDGQAAHTGRNRTVWPGSSNAGDRPSSNR